MLTIRRAVAVEILVGLCFAGRILGSFFLIAQPAVHRARIYVRLTSGVLGFGAAEIPKAETQCSQEEHSQPRPPQPIELRIHGLLGMQRRWLPLKPANEQRGGERPVVGLGAGWLITLELEKVT